ncbi:MAG: O-antigen ligase family protein [Xanthobacteraceae bacterium]
MNSVISIPLPRVATDAAFLPYTSFVVILATLFGGGGNQGWSDVVVQLAALPLLAWALFRLNPSQLCRDRQWAIALLCAMLALPLLQLIPMPPSLWGGLPGRGEIASAYQAAGMALPWLPVSLDSTSTWLALLSLLPATAVFLAMLSLEQRSRRILIVLILVVVFASVVLDVLQIMGGDNSSLRFYELTSRYGRAVGFFANSDHSAAFLYSAIPFIVAWAIGLVLDHSRNRTIGLTFLTLLMLAIIVGVATTQSRAGMALLFVAGLAGLLLAWRHGRGQSGRRLVRVAIGANLVGLILAFQFGFVALMQRAEQQGLEDLRWPVARLTSQAAIANMPFGSGLGTFVPIYERFAPRESLQYFYVNHAHNDWLELWLTGGAPAVILVLCFLVWFAAATFRLWRSGQPEAPVLDLALAQAASIVIILLLLHSVVDYPLRIPTLSVLFAIACAFLIPPRRIEHSARMSRGIENLVPANDGWPRNRYTAQ